MFLLCNTDLCVDVKTLLRTDRMTEIGKNYRGVLMRDGEEHYTFLESLPSSVKRNPHVFEGDYITVTCRADGSLRLNFKNLDTGTGFNVERYALGVYNELCIALEGLVERSEFMLMG